MRTNFLADFFDWNREVVEAAESPFARFAAFLLPILAPIVPAFVTSIRLYKLYLELISQTLPDQVALAGAIVTALVLEILGYVGTVAAVRFVYKWAKTRQDEYLIPMGLTGVAYLFYLVAMGLINVQLSLSVPNTDLVLIFLASLSVPAGLIFASNLVENEEKKSEYELRQENRQERLEKYRIRHGNVSGNLPEREKEEKKVSGNLQTDWRKIRPVLTETQVNFIANSAPKDIVRTLAQSGLEITPRTASNWKAYALDDPIVKLQEQK